MKTFNIYVDVVESFTVPIEANSKEEALEKAKYVEPSDYNVPHYSESIVRGVDTGITTEVIKDWETDQETITIYKENENADI